MKNHTEWVVNNLELVNNPEPIPLASAEPEFVVLMQWAVEEPAKITLKGRNMPGSKTLDLVA